MDDESEAGVEQGPTEHQAQPPAPAMPPRPTRRERRKRKKLLLFIVGGSILLLLLAAAAYWYLLRPDSKQTAQSATSPSTQTQEQITPADPTPATFKSTKLNIEITHRKDWTLKEAASGEITITSPRTSYASSDGQSTTGVFTVKIRKGVTDAMKTTIEQAVAARDSEVIAYAAPTDQQRQYTNLSYAGKKDVFNFFIVSGNAAFKTGNSLAYSLPLDGEFYLIAGGYGTDKSSSLSFDSVPVSSMGTITLEQAIDIVKSLKIY